MFDKNIISYVECKLCNSKKFYFVTCADGEPHTICVHCNSNSADNDDYHQMIWENNVIEN